MLIHLSLRPSYLVRVGLLDIFSFSNFLSYHTLVDLSVIYLQKATVPVVVSTPRVSTAAFLEVNRLFT